MAAGYSPADADIIRPSLFLTRLKPLMEGPTSHSYFSQRLRLHYVDWGNEGAPPLLMIHGGRDHCRNWDWVAEALRDDYHIIAPDLRGHGDSQWMKGGSYNHVDYVYDIAQLSAPDKNESSDHHQSFPRRFHRADVRGAVS